MKLLSAAVSFTIVVVAGKILYDAPPGAGMVIAGIVALFLLLFAVFVLRPFYPKSMEERMNKIDKLDTKPGPPISNIQFGLGTSAFCWLFAFIFWIWPEGYLPPGRGRLLIAIFGPDFLCFFCLVLGGLFFLFVFKKK